jgi:hypothetical protein
LKNLYLKIPTDVCSLKIENKTMVIIKIEITIPDKTDFLYVDNLHLRGQTLIARIYSLSEVRECLFVIVVLHLGRRFEKRKKRTIWFWKRHRKK